MNYEPAYTSNYNDKALTVPQFEAQDATEQALPEYEEKKIPKNIDTISEKIIKNGSLEIQVANIHEAKQKIDKNLKKFGAYIQYERFQTFDVKENLEMVIRVPSNNFDDFVNYFTNGVGTLDSKSIKIDDVTEEYTDVSIKLANKKIYLDKYRDLLKRSGSTKDMMEIQEKIRALEDEIDVAEGRLRYIDDRINLSELNLTLYKEKPRTSVTSKIGFGSRFMDSIAEGWNGFINFFLGIISLWPFVLLIPVIIFIFRKWKRYRKSKK